jgi:SAM-dependent methyltransferase
MRVAVIGCGYGGETLKIAPGVKQVCGIDFNEVILDKVVNVLSWHGVTNFVADACRLLC